MIENDETNKLNVPVKMELENMNLQEDQKESSLNSTSSMILNDDRFKRLIEFSEIMSTGRVSVPKHLQGNQSDCLAISLQAMQWGMNPFAVAQKTHLVNGALGYEAQLYNAVLNSLHVIRGRFRYEFIGDWERFREAGYSKEAESGCGVNVGAVLTGESEITWLPMPVFMSNAIIRNSPLWKAKPQQQLCYVAVRDWARLYAPDAVLGVYTEDELSDSISIGGNPESPQSVAGRYLKPKQKEIQEQTEPAKKDEQKVKQEGNPIISEKERIQLYEIGKRKGFSDVEMSFIVLSIAGVDSSKKIPSGKVFDMVLDAFQRLSAGKILPSDENEN